MRVDKQVASIHAFHMYATKDRVDVSEVPNEKPVGNLETTPISTVVPSIGDSIVLRENYVTLVSRVLVKHLNYFSPFANCVPEHIQHEHSAEMANKSEIVSVTFNCLLSGKFCNSTPGRTTGSLFRVMPYQECNVLTFV